MSRGVNRRPNGKWIARFRGPDRRERSKTFDTKRDADAWRSEQIANMRTGNWVDPSKSRETFAASAVVWIENKRASNLRPSTFEAYAEILESRVAPKWENYPLEAISVQEINSWTRELVQEGLSPSRINKCLLVVRQVLQVAVSNRLLGYNVMVDNINIVKPRGRRPEPRAFTSEEVFRLSAETPVEYQLLTEFLCFTGLRMSEVVALKVGDLDLKNGMVNVSRSTVHVRGTYYDGPPKSGKPRQVPLIATLVEKLRAHVSDRNTSDWLFPSKSGSQLTGDEYRRVFRHATVSIGQPDMTPHSCRDTFASLAVSAGVPITTIAQSLGHADPSITLRVYSTFYSADFGKLKTLMDAEARKGAQLAKSDKVPSP